MVNGRSYGKGHTVPVLVTVVDFPILLVWTFVDQISCMHVSRPEEDEFEGLDLRYIMHGLTTDHWQMYLNLERHNNLYDEICMETKCTDY